MAGHSHAANIKHRKNAQDLKKSAKLTKLVNTVFIIAKQSSEGSTQLEAAIKRARAESVPMDRIEYAIARAKGTVSGKNLESVRYNAAIGIISFVIECLTENKNRTASEVRHTITQNGGNVVDNSGVEFLFNNVGAIYYPCTSYTEEVAMTAALEAGCTDFLTEDDEYVIITNKTELHKVLNLVNKSLGDPSSLSLEWRPNMLIEDATEDMITKAQEMIDDLKSCNDVQGVFYNIKI